MRCGAAVGASARAVTVERAAVLAGCEGCCEGCGRMRVLLAPVDREGCCRMRTDGATVAAAAAAPPHAGTAGGADGWNVLLPPARVAAVAAVVVVAAWLVVGCGVVCRAAGACLACEVVVGFFDRVAVETRKASCGALSSAHSAGGSCVLRH